MAMEVDADYRFIVVDVRGYKETATGHWKIFGNSNLGKALQAGQLDVPPPSLLPATPELEPG